MTETDVPVLGVGSEQRQLWFHFAQVGAALLRELRIDQNRLGWSDAQEAARRHAQVERLADPPVRAMDIRERAAWGRMREDQVERRDVTGPAGTVTVSVGVVRRRWGLVAEATAPDGGQVGPAFISCADETTAKRLADDLLATGPDAVTQLQAFGTLAAERATTARADILETEQQRLERMADIVREVWPGPLGGAVASNPGSFGALVYRLHTLEERGFAPSDVLGRIDPDRLRRPGVQDPAALAEYFVKQMTFEVIDADAQDNDLDATAGHTTPRADRASDNQEAVDRLLTSSIPDLVPSLQRSRGYPALHAALFNLHEQGVPVERVLTDLPLEDIRTHADPAGYLAAVVAQRVEQDRPRPRGVDRTAMAELVRANVEQAVAGRIIRSPAWPWLARLLTEWGQEGLPVPDMLGSLPAERVYRAKNPAAYTIPILRQRADELRGTRTTDGAGTETANEADSSIVPTPEVREPPAAPHSSTSSPTTAPSGDDDIVLGQDSELAARLREARTAAGMESGPTEPWPRRGQPSHENHPRLDDGGAVDATLAWTERLNPDKPVDRVALEATVGLGSGARNARLDLLLTRSGGDTAHDAAHDTAQVAAADTAQGRAAIFVRAAASNRSEADDLATPRHEDLEGQDRSGVYDQLAAAERAEAAEQLGQATAAARRAEVPYTTDHSPTATPGHTPAGQRRISRQAPGQLARPTSTPRLSRERGRSR